jgi:hypothetical protein
MLQVQICLVAVRALVLAICVLGGCGGRLASSRGRSSRVGGQDTTATLLSDDVHRLRLLVGKDRRVWVQRRVGHAHAGGGAAHLVRIGVGSSGGQQRGLRVGRRHGHVRGRGLDGPQRRVLQRGHGAARVGGRGDGRLGRLRSLGVAVVAAIHGGELGAAVEGRQRGQLALGAVVGLLLLAQRLVLGKARLAEAVGGIHGVRDGYVEGVGRRVEEGRGRPIDVVCGELIRRTLGSSDDGDGC